MSSLRERFTTLDRMPTPDLWTEVERRASQPGVPERLTSVAVRIPARSAHSSDRTTALLAAALLVALLAGALAVGSGLVRLPSIVPVSEASPSIAVSPETFPSEAPSPLAATPVSSTTAEPPVRTPSARAPWVIVEGWAMRADGSDARQIQNDEYFTASWSRDGTRLVANNGRILVAEVGEEIGPFVDTGVEVPVNAQWEAFDFAPDGERVVFVNKSKCPTASAPFGVSIAETAGANCLVLSILDLGTGERVDLEQTLVRNQVAGADAVLELPAWSPDGTKIAYTVFSEGTSRQLWIVNADGTNPARFVMDTNVAVQEPRWSPDGTRIAFTSQTSLDTTVYVVNLESGRLTRVTTADSPGRDLCCADWLDDARLRVQGVLHPTDSNRFWLVTVDAAPRESRLLADLTDALTANGLSGNGPMTRSAPGDPGRGYLWQPGQALQP
jgi:dipeptidyl aminopeptidase/acylaminoacyl peptidase